MIREELKNEIIYSINQLKQLNCPEIKLKEHINRIVNFSKLNYLIDDIKKFKSSCDNMQEFIHFYLDKLIELVDAKNAMLIGFNKKGEIDYQITRGSFQNNPTFYLQSMHVVLQTVFMEKKAFCTYNNPFSSMCKKESCSLAHNYNTFCLPLVNSNHVDYEILVEGGESVGCYRQNLCDVLKTFLDTSYQDLVAYLSKRQRENRIICEAEDIRKRFHFENIIGNHPNILEILKFIAQIANTDATVLIMGESGTGKELIARAFHTNSARKHKPFVPINCSTLPESLMESELFGYDKGAFTGALTDKPGWFERADGGTIFLDEISEMPLALQTKFLRVLQTGEYSRLGSTLIRFCNVRVIAATNKNLKELVNIGGFREDLFYRLNVVDLELPPLRKRKCDIPLLIHHFIKSFCAKYGKENLHLSKEAEVMLMAYEFPGNVRELENIIHRAVVLVDGDTIEPRHLPTSMSKEWNTLKLTDKPSTFKVAKQRMVEKFEREFITDCLKANQGNISQAAQIAGINFKNFYTKMNKYGINPNYFKRTNGKN